MLRISMGGSADRLWLELEGRLAGAWVPELEDCWRKSVRVLRGRELWVDLTRVDGIDASGRYLLALMHNSGARLIAAGCMMSALIEEIAGTWPAAARRET